MPREQVNYPDLSSKQRQLDQAEGFRQLREKAGIVDEEPIGQFAGWNYPSLHVSWQPASVGLEGSAGIGHVQIGFEADLEYLRFAESSPNGVTADRTVMWTDVLSPGEIDRMITSLRKAKRKAFRE